MQLNACFVPANPCSEGNVCQPVNAEESWTWEQTARYIQDNLCSNVTLIAAEGKVATYELVRPGRLAQKWTPDMELSLGQASSLNESEQQFDWSGARNGPFQLYIYPKGSLIAIVEDATTHTIEWITFENAGQVAKTVPGFLQQIKETVARRREQLDVLVEPKGWKAKLGALLNKCKRDIYELDASNAALFERWREGRYEDPQFVAVVMVQSRLGFPLLEKLKNRTVRKGLIIIGVVALAAYAIEEVVPDAGQQIMEKSEEFIADIF